MSRHAYMQLGTTAAVSACLAAMIVVLGVLGVRMLGVTAWHGPAADDASGTASIRLPAEHAAQPARGIAARPLPAPPASVARAPVTHAPAREHRRPRAGTHRPKHAHHLSPRRGVAAPAAVPTPAIAAATAEPVQAAPPPPREPTAHAPRRPHPVAPKPARPQPAAGPGRMDTDAASGAGPHARGGRPDRPAPPAPAPPKSESPPPPGAPAHGHEHEHGPPEGHGRGRGPAIAQ